eukprot:COSAG02_NODE_8839_length_2424_cov_5.339355_1_plen_439_part_00
MAIHTAIAQAVSCAVAWRRRADGTDQLEYAPSAGAELLKVTLRQQSGSPVQVDLFDTPGEERWRALCDGYVSQAHGLVVVLEVFVDAEGGSPAGRRDQVHAPSLAAALSWLGRSVPTLLLALRTPSHSARPDLERHELPRSVDNRQSLAAQARAAGAVFAYVDSGASGAMGVEAALLGLIAAIDAERSRYGDGAAGRSPRRVSTAPASTASSGSNTSLNDSGEVQKLLAGIGGVLDADSSTDSIEGPGDAIAVSGGALLVPSRGSIFARFERHAGTGSQMSQEQFHELAAELWPDAEGLKDSVDHAIAAATTTWPLKRQGAKPLLHMVAVTDQLATAVGRRQGSVPSSLSVGDFTAGVRVRFSWHTGSVANIHRPCLCSCALITQCSFWTGDGPFTRGLFEHTLVDICCAVLKVLLCYSVMRRRQGESLVTSMLLVHL